MQIADAFDSQVPGGEFSWHPKYRGRLRQSPGGVVVEVGVGDETQVTVNFGEQPREPVTACLIAIGIGHDCDAAGGFPAEGAVAEIGQFHVGVFTLTLTLSLKGEGIVWKSEEEVERPSQKAPEEFQFPYGESDIFSEEVHQGEQEPYTRYRDSEAAGVVPCAPPVAAF